MTNDWTDEASELEALISAISEEACCAGWARGIELDVWAAMSSGRRIAHLELDPTRIERLRQLSQRIDGWLFYAHRPHRGMQVAPMDLWEQTFRRWQAGEHDSDLLEELNTLVQERAGRRP